MDAYEPNGGFGTPAPLAPGQSIEGTILPKGDSDWYRVDIDDQGALQSEGFDAIQPANPTGLQE